MTPAEENDPTDHDPTDAFFYKDRDNYLPAQISRIDGQKPLLRGLCQGKSQPWIGRFGLVVRVAWDSMLRGTPRPASFRFTDVF